MDMDKNNIKEELNRLYQRYYQMDKEYESAKLKRNLLTMLGFGILFFVLLNAIMEPTGWRVLIVLVMAIFLSGIHFFVNGSVFGWLAAKGREEGEHLNYIKRRISELEKEL